MVILYLTHLSGSEFAGPTYSVPKQIEAQSNLDDVFWYNATKDTISKWSKIPHYHDKNEFKNESIYELPHPYCNPDLVVVEGFYNMTKSPLLKELISSNIPYIIVPRSELTWQGQKRKWIKKAIANRIISFKFAKKARAIHYLTEQEYRDSGDKWNKSSFVVPNGIDTPNNKKTQFSKEGIKCVSIGRLEPYQKGLDMLIESCASIKEQLINKHVSINIYGPDTDGKKEELEKIVENNGLSEIIKFHDAVYGKQKESILLEHDIFVMPSRFEGHPMALIEAMGYGLPCIVTTGSNMSKEVQASDSGWIAESNVDSIRKAFELMVNETSKFKYKSSNAEKLSHEYNWKNISIKSKKIYTQLLQNDSNGVNNDK